MLAAMATATTMPTTSQFWCQVISDIIHQSSPEKAYGESLRRRQKWNAPAFMP
jgi:hypothetical protein